MQINRRGLMQALAGLSAAVPFLPKLIEDAEAKAVEDEAPADGGLYDGYVPQSTFAFELYDRAKKQLVGVVWGERALPFERLFCFATGRGFVFDPKQTDTLWWGDSALVMGPVPVPVHWDAKKSTLMQENSPYFLAQETTEFGGILLVEPGGHPFAFARHSEYFVMLPENTLTVDMGPKGIVSLA